MADPYPVISWLSIRGVRKVGRGLWLEQGLAPTPCQLLGWKTPGVPSTIRAALSTTYDRRDFLRRLEDAHPEGPSDSPWGGGGWLTTDGPMEGRGGGGRLHGFLICHDDGRLFNTNTADVFF